MNVFRVFGIGANKILEKGQSVSGIITSVHRSYLYVVKKPVRLIPNDRNTMYSHYIFFDYIVDNITYSGKLYVSLRYRCPQSGEHITVYYDPEKPQNYACYAFGPGAMPIGW